MATKKPKINVDVLTDFAEAVIFLIVFAYMEFWVSATTIAYRNGFLVYMTAIAVYLAIFVWLEPNKKPFELGYLFFVVGGVFFFAFYKAGENFVDMNALLQGMKFSAFLLGFYPLVVEQMIEQLKIKLPSLPNLKQVFQDRQKKLLKKK